MPAISVIVPTRFRNHLLPRALQSLFAQTFQDFEIVVIDDNPPDSRVGTSPDLSRLLQDPKVRLLTHDQPRNAASARNLGLRAARGEWIAYLDDDDAYQPTKLEKQWRDARRTGLPIGLCGATFHLVGRQRKWNASAQEYRGGDLLFMAFALPALFHRQANVLFEESLFAGEDFHYFFSLIKTFGVDRIFNTPELLVDIYPQPGPRVNLNAEAAWQACQMIHRDFAPAYGPLAAEAFLARARLGYLKLGRDGWPEMTRTAVRLLRLRGWKEARFIGNVFLFKLPWMRRLLMG